MHTTLFCRDQRTKIPKASSMFLALWALVPLCQNILQLIGRQRRVLSSAWMAASAYQEFGGSRKSRRRCGSRFYSACAQPHGRVILYPEFMLEGDPNAKNHWTHRRPL